MPEQDWDRYAEPHHEAVRRFVGFLHADDLKRTKGDKEALKDNAHRSRAPFHLILRLTGKAIENEGDGRQWHSRLVDLQDYVCSSEPHKAGHWQELHERRKRQQNDLNAGVPYPDMMELGMQEWRVLYDAHKHDQGGGVPRIIPDCRWVLDIVQYTTDQDEATRIKWNVKRGGKLTDKHTPAKPGWNKRNDNIVVLLPFASAMRRMTYTVHVARFGPLLTSFLAAMAPDKQGRALVIKYCLQQLLLFERLPMRKDRQTDTWHAWLPEHLHEWWAFHLLRRMFRMRFGCSMFDEEEQSGPILRMAPERDLAYMKYKATVKKAYQRLSA